MFCEISNLRGVTLRALVLHDDSAMGMVPSTGGQRAVAAFLAAERVAGGDCCGFPAPGVVAAIGRRMSMHGTPLFGTRQQRRLWRVRGLQNARRMRLSNDPQEMPF